MLARILGTSCLLVLFVAGGVAVKQLWETDSSLPADEATGIRLAPGFHATVFADGFGRARHVVVHSSGRVFVALAREVEHKGIAALLDTDGDGDADDTRYFGAGLSGTGMAIDGDLLYFGANEKLIRYRLDKSGQPEGDPVTMVDGFKVNRLHNAKAITLDGNGGLYVNFGAPSNACMEESRTKGSPGMQPCPLLNEYGGVWRYDVSRSGQMRDQGEQYSTGHRNAVALEWNPVANALYLVNHGRDQLSTLFPEYFSDEDSAELPAEEFHRVDKGADLGWPYSYYDQRRGERMSMPEYGGDGKTPATGGQRPMLAFPGHWAPNDLLFPSAATGLPTGALIAFHGSWNRAPLPQQGYRVVFVPMTTTGDVEGEPLTFADGFSGQETIMSPGDAAHRPMGLAEGPDGAIYITSMRQDGRIWRITAD